MNNKAAELVERLKEHPELLAGVESILDVVENKYGDMEKADDVEEMHKLGLKTLERWASSQSVSKGEKFLRSKKGRSDGKKTKVAYHLWKS